MICEGSLLENGPKVQAKGTSLASVPAVTAAGTFGLDWAQGRDIGTGSWHEPVPTLELRHRAVPQTGTK